MTHGISSELREKWYGALIATPNQSFLAQITILLGKIKTPYNKQHLLECLESHLSRVEVQKSIIDNLTDEDKAILSAVVLSRMPTAPLVIDLLKSVFDRALIMDRITLLTQIFVLYSSENGTLCVAPPLLESVSPFISYSTFLPLGDESEEDAPSSLPNAIESMSLADEADYIEPVSDMEIAALVSFVLSHKRARKVSGAFTASAARDAESMFQCFSTPSSPSNGQQSSTYRQEKLLSAMINLSLITEGDTLCVNWQLMNTFAPLPVHHREAMLCVAPTVNNKNIKMMQQLEQTLLDCAATARGRVISQATLYTIAEILFEADESGTASRYDTLLCFEQTAKHTQSAKTRNGQKDELYLDMIELFKDVINTASIFGFVQKKGDFYRFRFTPTECGGIQSGAEEVFPDVGGEAVLPLVSIDASFTVTVMPGLSLLQMLRIVPFLALVSAQTACVFSVTRESATHAFDMGQSVQDIIQTLEEYTTQKAPDSLSVSLESWYESYSSVHLYRGYVLCLTESAARRFECSPDYSKCVHKKIASGVYLLEVPVMSIADSNNETVKLLSRFGFKYIDKIEAVQTEAEKSFNRRRNVLPSVHNGRSIFDNVALQARKEIESQSRSIIGRNGGYR